jgi:hypothetical protein
VADVADASAEIGDLLTIGRAMHQCRSTGLRSQLMANPGSVRLLADEPVLARSLTPAAGSALAGTTVDP